MKLVTDIYKPIQHGAKRAYSAGRKVSKYRIGQTTVIFLVVLGLALGNWLGFLEFPFPLEIEEVEAAVGIGTVRTASDNGGSGSTPLDITSVDTSGSNAYLLVGVCINNDDNESVSTVILDPGGGDETSLTWLDNAAAAVSDDGRCELWGVVNPPGGTFTVRITLSAQLLDGRAIVAGAWPLTGVDQTDPRGSVATNSATSGNANVTITSNTDEVVFGTAFIENQSDLEYSGPGTEDWDIIDGSTDNSVGAHENGASPDVQIDWTNTSDKWAAIGVSIKPAVGGGGGIPNFVRSGGIQGTSFSFDIGSAGTDRLVVVIAGDEHTDRTDLTGVTVDDKSCNWVATAHNEQTATRNHQEMWYCDEANLGSSNGTVTVAITGGASDWGLHAHLYTDVSQAGPTGSWIDDTSNATNTVTVNLVDVPADGLVVMSAGHGSSDSISLWTSPLIQRQNGPDPNSARLAEASAVESSAQTDKTYVATWSGNFNRGTGIVAVWPKPAASGDPPTVTTNAATNVTTSTATLNGSANPNGAGTTGWFRYDTSPGTCNETFGTPTPTNSLGSGTSTVSYSENITDLSPSIPYYFCAIAENANGKVFGSVLTFTTDDISSISGYLISSTFDTGIAGGVKINTVLWQGVIGAGTSAVKFKIASANCSNGADDPPTCTTNAGWGGSKTSGDGALIGPDGTSSTFYTTTAPNIPAVLATDQHNNVRYFRYLVELSRSSLLDDSPIVRDVIINWSP